MPTLRIRSLVFPTDPEGHELNNRQPGSALAGWAFDRLGEAGIAGREPIQEDYGWGFWLDHDCSVWVAVGYAGEAGRVSPEWVLSVSHDVGCLLNLVQIRRSRACAPLVQRAFDVLHASAVSHVDIDVVGSE